jgi:hypothetical protein
VTEAAILRAILAALGARADVRLFRNDVGRAVDPSTGAYVTFGLCVGSSDLIGSVTPIWPNRIALALLRERFPALRKGDKEGELVAECPVVHGGDLEATFSARSFENGWAIAPCDLGCMPKDIFDAGRRLDQRESGDDSTPAPRERNRFVLAHTSSPSPTSRPTRRRSSSSCGPTSRPRPSPCSPGPAARTRPRSPPARRLPRARPAHAREPLPARGRDGDPHHRGPQARTTGASSPRSASTSGPSSTRAPSPSASTSSTWPGCRSGSSLADRGEQFRPAPRSTSSPTRSTASRPRPTTSSSRPSPASPAASSRTRPCPCSSPPASAWRAHEGRRHPGRPRRAEHRARRDRRRLRRPRRLRARRQRAQLDGADAAHRRTSTSTPPASSCPTRTSSTRSCSPSRSATAPRPPSRRRGSCAALHQVRPVLDDALHLHRRAGPPRSKGKPGRKPALTYAEMRVAIVAYVKKHQPASGNAVIQDIGGNRTNVRTLISDMLRERSLDRDAPQIDAPCRGSECWVQFAKELDPSASGPVGPNPSLSKEREREGEFGLTTGSDSHYRPR